MYDLNNKMVSVVIPVYNAGDHLVETLDSVLAQTFKVGEIVAVDDCSTDNSAEILRTYCEKYRNIVCLRTEHNLGVAVSRNLALNLAKGRYVAFLDSDDYWYPRKIEKQMALLEKTFASICFTAIEIVDGNGRLLKPKRDIPEKVGYKFLLKNTVIATSSVLVDRLKSGFVQMPLIRSGQDYAAWLQLLRDGTIAYGINDVLVKYRRRKNSLSSNKLKSIQQVWTIQTRNEKIGYVEATFNTVLFAYNAFKKHYV